MTWISSHWLVVGALALIAAAVGILLLLPNRAEREAFDEDLETAALPALPPDSMDLTTAADDPWPPQSPPDVPGVGTDPGPVDGRPAPPPLKPGPARRRAIHKGRIPHPQNLPGQAQAMNVAQLSPDAGIAAQVSLAGEIHREDQERLLTPVLAAELETGTLVAVHRVEARQAEADACWREIGRLRDEAYDWFYTPGRWELAA
jgi:hypothetical protein